MKEYAAQIKVELNKLERVKDEESKKFASHNIHFDFDIIVRVKEQSGMSLPAAWSWLSR